MFGLYQSWGGPPESEKAVTDQLQFIAGITPDSLRTMTIAVYAIAALSTAWVVVNIGAGKTWARTTLLIGVVLEALWVSAQSDVSALDYAADVPDFALQIYALYLLYTKPGRGWFGRRLAGDTSAGS